MEPISNHQVSFESRPTGSAGSRYVQAREYLGYHSEHIARQLNMNHLTLLDIENGTKQANEYMLSKFSAIYGRPVEWFSEGTADHETTTALTPLPSVITELGREEFRSFQQVIEFLSQEKSFDRKIEKLRDHVNLDNGVEEIFQASQTYDSSVETGMVDIFRAVSNVGVTTIVRPIERILGAVLRIDQGAGLLLSVDQPMRVLRFASASALGLLLVTPNLTSASIRKAMFKLEPASMLRKRNSELFELALKLLLPNFLLAELQKRQKWTNQDILDPVNIYQASLRLGATYESTVHAFHLVGCLSDSDREKLLEHKLIDIKKRILEDYPSDQLHSIDVWSLSQREEGAVLHAKPDDLFVMKLRENGAAGYQWDFAALQDAGFAILKDTSTIEDAEQIGAPSLRTVVTKPSEASTDEYLIQETCPWKRIATNIKKMRIKYRRSLPLTEGLISSDVQPN